MSKQKFPVTLSKRSARVIRRTMREQDIDQNMAYLRVGVKGKSFYLDITEQIDPQKDLIGSSAGQNMVIRRNEIEALDGFVIDYGGTERQSGFTFKHPTKKVGGASDPGGFHLSLKKLIKLHPELSKIKPSLFNRILGTQTPRKLLDIQKRLADHLDQGDSRAAVVIAIDPLVVAAYTDEMDCVALLHFPDWVVHENRLQIGSRLITSNTYFRPDSVKNPGDLEHGPLDTGRYINFYPVIAEFLTDDDGPLAERRQTIKEQEWQRATYMGQAVLLKNGRARDGRPLNSYNPG
ncbi:MAG: hypothetical protein AAF085_08145 [Planctomycetota bacterium]